MQIRSLLIVALALALSPAFAGYSGLIIIPTSDIVPRGEFAVTSQVDGSMAVSTVDTYLLNTQVGITNNLEAGLDYDFSRTAERRALLNAKYRFWESSRADTALAFGVCSLDHHFEANPYLVGTHDFGMWRLHAGVLGDGDALHPFAGVESPERDGMQLVAEVTEGPESYSAVGLNFTITPQLSLLPAMLLKTDGNGDACFSVQVTYTGTLWKGQ
jgi:hypothetical protein